MKFNIHGKKIDVTESIKSYIEEKIGRLDKYFENPNSFSNFIKLGNSIKERFPPNSYI